MTKKDEGKRTLNFLMGFDLAMTMTSLQHSRLEKRTLIIEQR